ncbi:MAG: hypothetical protein HGB12_04255 [Bacteroidetes bacterium]|nr:hypothetical protein [Bacteroidota bacterium]
MLRYIVNILIILVISSSVYAQDTLVLRGNYYGKNIYVLNPNSGSDTSFCVKKVLVNNQQSKDELHSNSFEIDFSLLNIPIGTEVNIFIFHNAGCAPKVLNTEVLQNQSKLTFVSSKVERTGKLKWVVKGEPNGFFSIEQYRWRKWITIDTVNVNDKKTIFSIDVKAHFGENTFRIIYTDLKGNTVTSKSVKYNPTTVKEIFLTSLKVTQEINFSGETAYEIFDDKGNLLLDGYDAKVNITELPKGKYWVNYDNKTEIVSKK